MRLTKTWSRAFRPLGAGAAAALLVAAATACGSSSPTADSAGAQAADSSTAQSAGAGNGVPTAAAIAQANAELAPTLNDPAFTSPTPFQWNAAAHKGQTIWYLGDKSVNIEEEWANFTERAVKSAGLNYRFYDIGSPISQTAVAEAFKLAIAGKAAAILFGESPIGYNNYVAEAKTAGIPVISLESSEPGHQPNIPGLYVDVSENFKKAGTLEADWIIANAGSKPLDVFTFRLGELYSTLAPVEALTQQLTKLDPGAKVTDKAVPFTSDIAEGVANTVRTAIESDPGIDFVSPPYDSMALWAEKGLPSGTTNITLTATDGVVPALEQMKAGNSPLKVDFGFSNEWLAYAMVDNALRALSKLPPDLNPEIGFREFNPQNTKSIDVTAENAQGWYGLGGIPADYAKVWAGK